ncbi:MAG TPA: orotate phosphoribosyltransferase [Nitrospirae bacterium]|nr:orotate phosphoribosyltransferase [bacterium BMS3Abin06]GBD98022.1 orotate phosphoribosyltransferase [bacterium BMS3Abin07]HDH13422.1 orotate phosphoribosyltransferase [Nitrospirota bacterium]HDZ02163.1 orotate phosphoribosyltransferase [Nitrospirota bacterium]
MTKRKELISYIQKHSFKQSSRPIYKLSSGKKSKFYFNLKTTTYSSKGQYLTGSLVYKKIQELKLKPEAIGGLTLGADPIATSTAYHSYGKKIPLNAFVIRKEPKEHGMKLQIEGSVKAGERVVIVDDVVTTGQSTIKAIKLAEKAKLKIIAVIILLDRCEQNGKENIEKCGYPVYSILSIKDFI